MKQLNWYQIFGKSNIPDGRTVTPTDDIQIWLNCANIWDKTYTTLAEVLADTDTLSALINSENAVDYMVRSTTWAVATALVPTMTSNTTPSGECSADTVYGSSNPAWKSFDGLNNTNWTSTNTAFPHWLKYKFPTSKVVKAAKFVLTEQALGGFIKNYKIQGSNDNSTWVDLVSGVMPNTSSVSETVFVSFEDNETAYSYYRLYVLDNYRGSNLLCAIYELQYYDYAASITGNATAMSLIGANNYAADTLLADATWFDAICNSTYFESVLNVKVPAMTDETHPYGETFCTNFYSTGANEHRSWKAFDGTMSADTYDSWASTTTNSGVGYHFVNAVSVCVLQLQCPANVNNNEIKNFKIQYSEDGVTWNDASDTLTFITAQPSTAQSKKYVTNTYTRKAYWRILALTSYGNQNIIRVNLAQFYGREDV